MRVCAAVCRLEGPAPSNAMSCVLCCCRAPVSHAADVQVAVLWQWCACDHAPTACATECCRTAEHALRLQPHLVSPGAPCNLAQLHAADWPHPYDFIQSVRNPPGAAISCLLLWLCTLQTAGMQQQTAASPAGVSCASPWRETSLCATSHTRWGLGTYRLLCYQL